MHIMCRWVWLYMDRGFSCNLYSDPDSRDSQGLFNTTIEMNSSLRETVIAVIVCLMIGIPTITADDLHDEGKS